MDEERSKQALVVIRPKVLAEISDLRVDNGFSELVIPEKDDLVWTPDQQGYENGGLIMPVRGTGDASNLQKFEDVKKRDTEIRSIQMRINRELYCDEIGGIARLGYDAMNFVKKKLGMKVRTLEDLFDEEQKKVEEMTGALNNLYGLCDQHYLSLMSFMDRGDESLEEIFKKHPKIVDRANDARRGFESSRAVWSRHNPTKPEYYRMRRSVRHARDAYLDAQDDVRISSDTYQQTNMYLISLDVASQILRGGRRTVQMLGIRYKLAGEFLQAWPAFVTVRNLFKYFTVMKDVSSALNTTYEQVRQIEAEFENPKLLGQVYHALPSLQSHNGMAGAVDTLNTQLYLSGAGRRRP
jgi:hypothetical protein